MDREDLAEHGMVCDDGLGGGPPLEEGDRGGGGSGAPPGRAVPVVGWLLLIALAGVVRRLSMAAFTSESGPLVQGAAVLVVIAAPTVAGVLFVRAFLRAQRADRRRLRSRFGR